MIYFLRIKKRFIFVLNLHDFMKESTLRVMFWIHLESTFMKESTICIVSAWYWDVQHSLMSNMCLQPLMLIVPDIQDVYTPLQTDVVVQLSEVSFLAV